MSVETRSIVVACDASAQSLNAAKMAAELAQATRRPLKLISVYPASSAELLAIRGVKPDDMQEDRVHYGREMFDAAKQVIGDAAESAEEILLKGDPSEAIIEYMENNPGTHLVMGRRGHSMVRSLTLGSTSEKVIRHASGTVTVVSD